MSDRRPPSVEADALKGEFARPLVVLPTFNEIASLPGVVEQLLAVLPTVSILVVDDDSPDGTGSWAQAFARSEPRLDVLQRRAKLGLGSAYKSGFAWGLASGYSVLVEMDADGSHAPLALPSLLAQLQHGADLALGSRYAAGGTTPGWPMNRRVLSRTSNVFARSLLGVRVADATTGYRAYRADILRTIDVASVASDGYAFQIETLWRVVRLGGRVVEVPITFHDRVLGASKISRHEVAAAAWTLLRLRRQGWRPAAASAARLAEAHP
jgi:glycosyltransferase involved in cell wall biosynthesis